MLVKEYDTAGAFLEEYETVMLEREAVSHALLSHAYEQVSSGEKTGLFYGTVTEEGEARLLYCIARSGSLILYPVSRDRAVPAAAALADDFGTRKVTVSGVSARLELCQSFMEQYKRHIHCTFVQQLGVDIMEIRKVNDITPAEGVQRLAFQEEAKQVAGWMLQYQIDAQLHEVDYEAALQRAQRLISEEKVFLFENGEKLVVSMAVAGGELIRGMAITDVFTPEEYRGRGYAAANIYYLSKALLEEGYEFCTISVDKKNPLSNRAYEKVGYQYLEDSYEYLAIPEKPPA